jgi:hypothetical protein
MKDLLEQSLVALKYHESNEGRNEITGKASACFLDFDDLIEKIEKALELIRNSGGINEAQ